MKKAINLLLVLIISLTLIMSVVNQAPLAHAQTNSSIDAMLVIDASTSMNTSDKDKVANEAMKLFIDMSSVQGDRIGMIAYTDTIIREKALFSMDSVADKDDLKIYIDNLTRGPYTDIAVGVSEAIKVIEKSSDGQHAPMIVLLADGNNSLPDNRSQADSDKELNEAIDKAKSLAIPIYTIGLNADGKLNKDLLANIATSTNGKTFVTNKAEDLPSILSEIFADHLKLKVMPLADVVANGEYQDVKVNIPNTSVIEANISMMSNSPVDLKLFKPDGSEAVIGPSGGILLSKSNSYSMLKLVDPELGDWVLQVKGVPDDQIDINLIFNYDMQLKLEVNPNQPSYALNDKVTINAFFESNGQPITDPDSYNNMIAKLYITDSNQYNYSVDLVNNGNTFSGEFLVNEALIYELQAKVEDASFYRESELITIDATAAATPAATATPTKTPTTSAPATPDKEFPWLIVIIILVSLIILIVLIVLIMKVIKEKNKGFFGQLILEIHDLETDEVFAPQYRKLNAFKGKVNLHQLLQLKPEFKETEAILFKPGHNAIVMFNETDIRVETVGRAIDASKGRNIKNGDKVRLVLQKTNKTIQIEFRL